MHIESYPIMMLESYFHCFVVDKTPSDIFQSRCRIDISDVLANIKA